MLGTPLTDVNLALIQSAVGVAGARIFDMLPALTSLCALCDEASHSKLSLEGETNLLSHEELGSDLYKILGLLTGKKQLMELSKRFANSNHTKYCVSSFTYHPFHLFIISLALSTPEC